MWVHFGTFETLAGEGARLCGRKRVCKNRCDMGITAVRELESARLVVARAGQF